ncbi:hypothetical protein OZ13_02200 [Xanthomonas cannabis pv. cannabis]|nr:hypothetical protein OZ13_02200 [Xanthomonas cannabis pv. cannabis]
MMQVIGVCGLVEAGAIGLFIILSVCCFLSVHINARAYSKPFAHPRRTLCLLQMKWKLRLHIHPSRIEICACMKFETIANMLRPT